MNNPAAILVIAAAMLIAAPSCSGKATSAAPEAEPVTTEASSATEIKPGAARPDIYMPLLKGKRIGLLSNHTGVVAEGDSLTHTLDYMLRQGADVRLLFSPEHGFRGRAEAGEKVGGGVDGPSGLPVVSLYNGKKSGPTKAQMDSVDVIVVDLQDVGARFYTYHITMLEMMEAAARAGKPVVVLDRPNPLGMVVDGPMLEDGAHSGVGRIPMPVIHGLTMGEIAEMANGEGWLANGLKADLTVVPAEGYTHASRYSLPVSPSPNLRSDIAILLYPSLCLFEGTPVSVGRGTPNPFTLYGSPQIKADKAHPFMFTPRGDAGAANPPFKGLECHGRDLSRENPDSVIARGLNLDYVIDAYRSTPGADAKFFKPMFRLLAGTNSLRDAIMRGESAADIKRSWQPELDAYKALRARYLLYPEE